MARGIFKPVACVPTLHQDFDSYSFVFGMRSESKVPLKHPEPHAGSLPYFHEHPKSEAF